MLPLGLCKMLLLNQIAHETPIYQILLQSRNQVLISSPKFFIHPALPCHGLSPSVPSLTPNSVTFKSKYLQTPLRFFHTALHPGYGILAPIFRTLLRMSVCPESCSLPPRGETADILEDEILRAGTSAVV